ncbi:hypothetical protein HYALB_00007729 [Hymenoscyphus albidus]|uniref:Uncharacterized protein n=1 Tax=Hymenoscyphus albidus TaxID=595503 RepID=A0A9N9LI68_9HELO|nr:hypothetical protein HYALB_00007729 [Hymenoscyphus albidus]
MFIPAIENAVKALPLFTALQKPIFNAGYTHDSFSVQDEIPDGPFSLCEVSRATDLLAITSVSLSKRPVLMISLSSTSTASSRTVSNEMGPSNSPLTVALTVRNTDIRKALPELVPASTSVK